MVKAVTHLQLRFAHVWRSRFMRNVAIIASGTAAAQTVNMASAPLITRIFGPEAFGLLGAYAALVAVAVPIAALAYPIAIVLPREDRDALNLVRLSVILSFGVAALTATVLAYWGKWLLATIGTESLARYMLLFPVAMLFGAWLQVIQHWLIRKRQFGFVARCAVANSLVLNSARIGIGWLNPVGAVLIVIATLGQALHVLFLFIGMRRRFQMDVNKSKECSRSSLKEVAFKYRDFPLYRAPQNFINAASQSLPVLMLAAFFGPTAAGFYTLAAMVMGIPSTLVGNAVKDVFYPHITEAANEGENLPRHILLATGTLLAIGIFPFGLVMGLGPWLFVLVFGQDWLMAGEYARWLALFFLFNFINKPAVAAVPVLGIQRGLLLFELFSTGTKALGLLAGIYWFDSDLWAVALFSVLGFLAYCAMMLWILSRATSWRTDAKTG